MIDYIAEISYQRKLYDYFKARDPNHPKLILIVDKIEDLQHAYAREQREGIKRIYSRGNNIYAEELEARRFQDLNDSLKLTKCKCDSKHLFAFGHEEGCGEKK